MIRLLFILLLSPLALAEPVKVLPASTFQVYVRPQLVNIQQDIEQILLTFPGYPKEVFDAQRLVDELMNDAKMVQGLCPKKINQNCKPQVENTLQRLRELERQWIAQEGRITFSSDTSIAELAGKRRWIQMLKVVQDLRGKLEVEVLALSSQRSGSRITSFQIRKAVDELDSWQELMVVEYVPGRLQEDFRSAWMNFFRPLQKQCVLGNNRLFLSTNLESLNFYWNLLNVKLTKRLKKTPEGMIGPLNAIQNRWNQVMRTSFGQ